MMEQKIRYIWLNFLLHISVASYETANRILPSIIRLKFQNLRMNIFLFHRDLRLFDNTSLIRQLKQFKKVTPIFIFPPVQIDPKVNKYFSHHSVQFMV